MAPPALVQSMQTTKQSKKKSGKMRKGESSSNAPIFLRKTYTMIDTCDPSIAEWSDHGDTFVVKDTEKFAAKVIPEFFKHNNFSSFVRQLNFYGFRKIKSDPLRLKDAEDCEESKYWKFKHDLFQQGRPDLLAQIKKSNHNESADKQEVETLKSEVKDLRDQLNRMSKDMTKLTSVFGSLVQSPSIQPVYMEPTTKKRKVVDVPPSPVSSTSLVQHPLSTRSSLEMTPLPVASAGSLESNFSNNATSKVDSVMSYVPDSVHQPDPIGRIDSVGLSSFSSQDEDMLNSLLLTPDDEIALNDHYPDLPPDLPLSMCSGTNKRDNVDPKLMEKLRNSLANLPQTMQELFVERIVATIAEPETFKKQVEAVTALAAAAAEEAKRRIVAAGVHPDDSKCVPLAAAVLAAYLERYDSKIRGETESKF